MGEEEGTRKGDGQDEQGKPTAASDDFHVHKIIPAWPCTLPNYQNLVFEGILRLPCKK